jgi:Carbonic anhydrases/acetyltransferases, isoleucine patch superfamily
MIERLPGRAMNIDPSCYIHPTAVVMGEITMGAEGTILCQAVLRADLQSITIGKRCNIQDGVILHVGRGMPQQTDSGQIVLGDDVSIGHRAVVHGCRVGNNVLIGIGAIVLSGAQIGDNCIIAAGAVVTEGSVIPPGSMVMGMPGKVTRTLRNDEIDGLHVIAAAYAQWSKDMKANGTTVSDGAEYR